MILSILMSVSSPVVVVVADVQVRVVPDVGAHLRAERRVVHEAELVGRPYLFRLGWRHRPSAVGAVDFAIGVEDLIFGQVLPFVSPSCMAARSRD